MQELMIQQMAAEMQPDEILLGTLSLQSLESRVQKQKQRVTRILQHSKIAKVVVQKHN